MTNKDLISQYVDTGLKLPEYQIMKLSNQDRKTYVRKRLIAHKSGGKPVDYDELQIFPEKDKMEWAEYQIDTDRTDRHFEDSLKISYRDFLLFTPEDKLLIAIKYLKKGILITDRQFDSLLPKDQEKLVDMYGNNKIRVSSNMFMELPLKTKIRYIFNMRDNPDGVSYLLSRIPKEVATKYVIYRFNKGFRLGSVGFNELELLPVEMKKKYLIKKFDSGILNHLKEFSPEERFQIAIKLVDERIGKTVDLDMLLPEDRVKYIIKMAENWYNLEKNQFDLLPPKNQMDYISKMSELGRYMINIEIFNSLPIDVKKQYILKRYKNRNPIPSDFVQYLPQEIRDKHNND